MREKGRRYIMLATDCSVYNWEDLCDSKFVRWRGCPVLFCPQSYVSREQLESDLQKVVQSTSTKYVISASFDAILILSS